MTEDEEIKELVERYSLDESKLRKAIQEEKRKWREQKAKIEKFVDLLVEEFDDNKEVERQLGLMKKEGLIEDYERSDSKKGEKS